MKIEILDGAMLKNALAGAARFLEDNKEEVNSLNVFPVPDGDTGTNMSLTVNSAIKQGLNLENDSVSKIASAASHGSLMGARGNSGVILSQLFRGFANGLGDRKTADTKVIAHAFKQAADTAYKAVMKPTEGTILTVARECGDFAISICKEESDILNFLKRTIDYGETVLAKTPEMLPVLKQAGVVDAGGKGLLYVLLGAYYALSGKEISIVDLQQEKDKDTEAIQVGEHLDTEDIKFAYCTEFIINTDYDNIESFREELSIFGDSLMAVGGGGLIKVHIHTNNPGTVMERALELGELTDIKIDNMKYQHEEILLKSASAEYNLDKKYSFISISAGEGIDAIFRDLNVDVLVAGGQTMNPSTEDIIKAIDKTTGENVFIFPNNSNIILAAEQTKELSNRNIVVIPSKTIPQGISALLSFSESKSLEDNIEEMMESIKSVKTGQVTYSVRDTEFNNTKIYKDDIIGIFEDNIVANGKDINIVSSKLIENMIDEDISLVTILYGSDITEEIAKELESQLSSIYDEIDIELIYGGQPIYYYIFSVE
ncbi:MAG: DAK2 domain-containing protein [Tissierellaceae bacterium]